jgi:hypothetical protein
VRGADTDDRALTPESAGLYAAATGFQATSRDDFDNMARQFPMYDALRLLPRADRDEAAAARALRLPARSGEKRGRRGALSSIGRGLTATPTRPRPVTIYDLDSAARVERLVEELTAPR